MPKNNDRKHTLPRQELHQLYACLYDLDSCIEQIRASTRGQIKSADEILAYIGSWGKYYEYTFTELIRLYATLDNSVQCDLTSCANAPDANLEMIRKIASDAAPETFIAPDNPESIAISLAAAGNIQGIKMFDESICHLVKLAASGDDSALFMAVYVDPAVMQSETVSRRICAAHLAGDNGFMEVLVKAISRKQPRRLKKDYDEVRLMLTVMDEMYGLHNISDKDIISLLLDDLQLGPPGLDDASDSVTKLIQEKRRKSRK